MDLPEYDAEKIHLSRLPIPELHRVADPAANLPRADRMAFGSMHPGRVDVIGGGALIVTMLADELAKRAGITELVVSEHDILDGIALSLRLFAVTCLSPSLPPSFGVKPPPPPLRSSYRAVVTSPLFPAVDWPRTRQGD